ncbi:hypothetical protein V1264_013766 [Littorina saxatilis]|uniref:Uncharacterized protein n=1 Tax=Littorina saxatilis TaxID=31220 RepID=A0AAN9BNW9_9CAEN
MPRGRDALTLKQTCINVIARNFERLWAQHFDKQFGDIPRLLHVIGPFHDLPGQLCQDILQALLNLRLLRKSHLQLLLVPQITQISFAATYANSISAQTLDILALRCRGLVSLNLTNSMSLSPGAISQCLSSLPLLRTLVLKQTKINDPVMKVIAMSLPRLTHLDLHACPITDKGAVLFCGDHGDFDPVCVDLTLLDISATKIDLAGCSAIIECYPKLRSLSHADSVEAVARLHKRGGENKVNNIVNSIGASTSKEPDASESDSSIFTGQHRLEILYATALRCRRIDPESVRLACHHCPNVREVYWYQDASDESLNHLKPLKHLAVLEVTSDKPQAVTFHGGILPLVRSQGEEMLSLGLYDVQDTDLALLGSLCPKLQRLKLVSMHEEADFSHSYLSAQQRALSFQQLRQLTLVFGGDSTRLDSHDLEHVLVNACSLQELHFIEVQALTDEVLVAALSVHGFPCLKKFQLESCNEITSVSMNQLAATSSPLTQLKLKRCHLITYQDFEELKSMVNAEGG